MNIKSEPDEVEVDIVSPSESNDDAAREEDIIDGFLFLSYTSFESLERDASLATQQSESTYPCKREKGTTPRLTVDTSGGRHQVNWRSIAADTENNNSDKVKITKGRRNDRYKESISP